jgi:glycerophosphoryl diester phosphodiesterase
MADPDHLVSKGTLGWLITTGIFAGLGALTFVVPPEAPSREAALPPALPPGFDLQGHRGARGLFPENSLAAVEGALALGVTTLELDLVMTRDGALVVHHDRRLDPERTRHRGEDWLEAPGPLLIELDRADLSGFDLGRLRPESDAARRFPDQQGLDGVVPPGLAEVLERAEALSGGAMRYNLETKLSPLTPGESAAPDVIARALVTGLRAAGVSERVTVQSFDWRTLREVRSLAPEIAIACLTAERDGLDNIERGRPGVSPWTAGLDVDDFDGSLPRLVKAAGAAVWSPFFRDLRLPELREARRLGLRVIPYTVNDPADMASLIELGVDGLITDYPDRLRRVMDDRGMALPPAFPADG